MITHNHYLTIVGAGPIGIEMAVALKREGVPFQHLEASQIGSTIGWWAPETKFFSSVDRIQIAGVPIQRSNAEKATREEYLAYLRSVVKQFDLKIETFSRVEGVTKTADGFQLEVSCKSGRYHLNAEKLILAIGDMHRPRLLKIPGEDRPQVSHYLQEPHRYFNRQVVIVGGKNSAVEAALRLYHVGAKVTLSYRGNELDPKRIKYWLMPEIAGRIKRGEIKFIPNSTPTKIDGDNIFLLTNSGQEIPLPADDVLLLTGYEQDPTLFQSLGIELNGEGRSPTLNRETMESSVKGVFVIGTAVAGTQLGGVRLFIENSHIHVDRVMAALAGSPPPVPSALDRELES